MAKAKKIEAHKTQGHLFPQMRRDYNPFWMSSLFSDVYLKNDVPRVYKHLWENDEIENSESGFAKFYQGFVDLAIHHENSKFESWNEAQTVHDWIVPIMDLLGWENNSVKGTSSYLDNETFNIENQTYKPDLIYFDKPKYKEFTQKHKKDVTLKLNEIRNSDTGAKMVVEAKHWNRLTSNRNEGKKDAKLTDSAVSLGPELQTLKYMEVLGLDFGILTDGKIWKLFHKELSKSVDKRSFTFDLGKLKEIAQDLYSHGQEELFRENAKYFYYFFAKSSFYQVEDSKVVPIVREVFDHSKKYAHEIEEDLKKRFIITMGLTCNALKNSCKRQKEEVDLETIRNVAESHLFNILFVKSCEVRQILPIKSPNYLKVSLHEIIEYLDFMHFDPEKGLDTFFKYFQTGTAFGGKEFTYDGFQIFDRFINLYEIIHDGTNKSKDFGFEIEGFKESIFSKDEWKFATKHKITNGEMIRILFTLNFIESNVPGRNHQQIPYSYFTPRQMGSIYESFLEYRLEEAKSDMIFKKGQWGAANLNSNQVRQLKLVENYKVNKGELFFSPNNEDRKMTGSYYTPDYIVKYIIDQTIGPLIKNKSSDEILSLKICDPAMGSGHFLAGALDYLVSKYRLKWCEENNDDLNETVEETSRKILDSCLFGADINKRAVKLAQMSLWLMTAFPGKKLERLDDQFKIGDSLLEISWEKDFLSIFKRGGFDAVVGNPPYVRQEFLKAHKKSLEKKYHVYESNNDLYAYFLELGVKLTKQSGYFGMIVTNKWMRADYGEKLRRFMVENGLETVLDFGDLDVFPGIAAYPVIVTSCKASSSKMSVKCLKVDSLECSNFVDVFKTKSFEVQKVELVNNVWTDFNDISKNILTKCWDFSESLKDYINEESYSGIKTGLTKVYVISQETRNLLISECKSSKDIIKPFAVGKNIKKYKQIAPPNFILFLPKGWTNSKNKKGENSEVWFSKNYPAIFNYLKLNKKSLEARSDQGDYWWELRACDYYDVFEGPKISYLMFQTSPCFTFDKGGIYTNNAVWSFRVDDLFLLGLLNSKVGWFFISNFCTQIQGGYQTAYSYMSKIPIPKKRETGDRKNIRETISRLVGKVVEKDYFECLELEEEINQNFYKYYNLSENEMRYIEKLSEKIDMASNLDEDELEEAA